MSTTWGLIPYLERPVDREKPFADYKFNFLSLSYPNLESPKTTACKTSVPRDRAKDWEPKPAQFRP